ncbi:MULTISPECIES: HIT family protein [unclassified Desulfosporosinus]|uniref:HIT family protein n=1 Tax=unclassified Desulfosporosinus TaxID=2633794 RepID=UPI000223A466|nr:MULTISPECIES: HIT family protein [unclassified Desulfosporosinus]EGW38560.1 HIT domain protein [Desulfosporosinus sp. OT]ODA40353.1 HIT family hydrolase [Desulfosporosinus sp. BG]
MNDCVFCTLPETQILVENELARAFFDKYPVSAGHVLIVPKRHTANLFDATKEEMASIGDLLRKVKEQLDEQFHPDGYNVGVNVGEAAGQTVFHLHVHVIPRYHGDAGSVQWHS